MALRFRAPLQLSMIEGWGKQFDFVLKNGCLILDTLGMPNVRLIFK
jgi:hypothetical protein